MEATPKTLKELSMQKSPKGEILGAKGKALDGSGLHFVVEKGKKGKNAAFGTVRFFENDRPYLSVTAVIDGDKKAASLQADGEGLQLAYTLDFSKADKVVPIVGTVNGKELRGTVDMQTHKASVDFGLESRLSSRNKARLAYFEPILKQMRDYYDTLGKPSTGPSEGDVVPYGFWGSLSRGLCWGLGAAVGAGCCVGSSVTAFTGCVLCAGASGACASVCSDSVTW